ncbi:MAG: nucleotide exchange factor GrpE [Sphingobacteriales bacterium]|nr:MAG: nucleotide exchange factor GrpE [Sphingobacteriales bacterium]
MQSEEQTLEDSEKTDESAVEKELADMKDKYLRLAAEFDNFRRRTAKEKLDFAKTAGQDLMTALLPVLDDLERARQSMETAQDVESLKQGVELVFAKMMNTLQQKGLKAIDAIGQEFDVEQHEAITQIPAPGPDMKGKVIDQVEKGYTLGDKVIRFAKVVIGA